MDTGRNQDWLGKLTGAFRSSCRGIDTMVSERAERSTAGSGPLPNLYCDNASSLNLVEQTT